MNSLLCIHCSVAMTGVHSVVVESSDRQTGSNRGSTCMGCRCHHLQYFEDQDQASWVAEVHGLLDAVPYRTLTFHTHPNIRVISRSPMINKTLAKSMSSPATEPRNCSTPFHHFCWLVRLCFIAYNSPVISKHTKEGINKISLT